MVANESDWHLLVKGMRSLLPMISIMVTVTCRADADVHAILSSLHMLLLKTGASEDDPTAKDNRPLVAAAISRLCLVLCAEWGKPQCGSAGQGVMEFAFTHMATPDTDPLPSSVLDFHRQLSGSSSSSHGNGGQKCEFRRFCLFCYCYA